jgi:hypothetical protein
MKEMKLNFLVKENEEEMYNKIRERFIKNGYKPQPIIKTTFSCDCRKTKTSNYPFTKENNLRPYPYTITIKYQTAA